MGSSAVSRPAPPAPTGMAFSLGYGGQVARAPRHGKHAKEPTAQRG